MTMSSNEARDRFEIDGMPANKARLQTTLENDECSQRPKAAERHLANSGNAFHLDFPQQVRSANPPISNRPDLEFHWLAIDVGGAELMTAASGSPTRWSPIALAHTNSSGQGSSPRLLAAPAVEPSLSLRRRTLMLICMVVILLVLLVSPP
jgi:hypothetical protein